MNNIRQQGTPLTKNQIDLFEHELGAKLSESYRMFLIKNNGGRPEFNCLDIEGLPGSPTDVKIFFGIGRDVETSDLLWNLNLIRELYPELKVLPIASDSCGSLICLKVCDGTASEVVFLNFSEFPCQIFNISKNFDEFIKMLRSFDD